jgi:hypothetical protein
MAPYLKSFIIGSSCIVFLPFFYIVSNFNKKDFNYDYTSYTFIAPIWLGLMNMFSLLISEQYHFSPRERFLFISIFAPTIVLSFVVLFKMYNYSTVQWIKYIIMLYLLYFFIWNVVVYNLEKYI